MPSTSSSSVSRPLLSSTVMTPSLPTFSMASATISPIAGSAAEMAATWAIFSRSLMGTDCSLMAATTASTASSMPFFSWMGLAPAATFCRPALMSAWARTVAVVVPSPAMSLVLDATSLTSWAPMFWNGSSSSISFAMVTPSLVIVGDPNFLSRTTFRPFGPMVIFTALATRSTPLRISSRASASKSNCLAIELLLPPRCGRVQHTGNLFGWEAQS